MKSKKWTTVQLGEICAETLERSAGRDVPIMSVSKNLGVLPQSERFKKRIASTNTSRYKVIYPGDFVFDPMLLWTGSISRFEGASIGIVSPAYSTFRVDDSKANPSFLFYFLKTPERIQYYKNISFGTNQRRQKAQFHDFAKLEIPFPPLSEQERLVRLLDEADALRRLRARADERMAEFIPELFHEMFGDPVRNEKGWPVAEFGEICECRLGKMLDAKQQTGQHQRPYLRNVNVQWGRFDLSDVLEMDFDEKSREVLRLRAGDILICEGGEVGRCAIWNDELPECYFQKALHRARPNSSQALSDFIMWFMWSVAKSGGLSDFTTQSTIAHLTGVKLNSLPVPLPPISLQREFAARAAEARALEEKQAQSAVRLEALFESMLAQAFAGEL